MTCNNKCIHYPVCEQKKYDFANIDDCPHYLDLSEKIRTIKVPTYPDGEEYCIRCIPIDVFNEYMSKLYGSSRLQGTWLIDGHHRRCSCCNEYTCAEDREGDSIPDSFCPNCGAKMTKMTDHKCYTLSRNKTTCDVCGADLSTDWVHHQNKPQEEPNYTSISTGYATYTAEDIRTCDSCKHNAGLPHNNGTLEYSGACKKCVAKDMWEVNHE